jgi:hypothetical protein
VSPPPGAKNSDIRRFVQRSRKSRTQFRSNCRKLGPLSRRGPPSRPGQARLGSGRSSGALLRWNLFVASMRRALRWACLCTVLSAREAWGGRRDRRTGVTPRQPPRCRPNRARSCRPRVQPSSDSGHARSRDPHATSQMLGPGPAAGSRSSRMPLPRLLPRRSPDDHGASSGATPVRHVDSALPAGRKDHPLIHDAWRAPPLEPAGRTGRATGAPSSQRSLTTRKDLACDPEGSAASPGRRSSPVEGRYVPHRAIRRSGWI